jgi:hypothetical protein
VFTQRGKPAKLGAMASPRRPPAPLSDVVPPALIDELRARLRKAGLVPESELKKLGLTDRARQELLSALGQRGAERTKKGLREPLAAQIAARLEGPEPVARRALLASLAGATAREAEAALEGAISRGEAHVVLWKLHEALVRDEGAALPPSEGPSMLDEIEAEVRSSGALALVELKKKRGLSDRGIVAVGKHLEKRGIELAPASKSLRLPLADRIVAAVSEGARVPEARLADVLAGQGGKGAAGGKGARPSKDEVARAVAQLAEQGRLRLVVRGSLRVLVGAAEQVLGEDELGRLEQVTERLALMLAARRPARRAQGPTASLLRDDVLELLSPLVAQLQPGRPPPALGQLLSAMRDLRDDLGLVGVPALVRRLSARMTAAEVHGALRQGQQAGLLELRPEPSPQLLRPEDLALCIPGPRESLLSKAALLGPGLPGSPGLPGAGGGAGTAR